MKNYRALVIGATGGVGAFLVEKLLASNQCSEVTIISRKACPKRPKLNNIVWDNFSEHFEEKREENLEVFKNHDVIFCCLGASEKALLGLFFNKKKYAPLFQKVDYEYVVGAAGLAKEAGIAHFSVISSPTAKPKAKFIYSKIKWEMEQSIQSMGFEKVSIFHPYHLMKPVNNQVSFFKRITKNFVAFIASIMPAKQRAIKVEDVATAMLLEFESRAQEDVRLVYYTSDDMRELNLTAKTRRTQ